MRQHALVSPSGAHRWMHCPRSARYEEQFEDRTSDYADEGTLGHSIAEVVIKYYLGKIGNLAYIKKLEEFQAHKLYSEALFDHCKNYATFVIEQYNEVLKATGGKAEIFIEETFDLTAYIPEGYGHLDAGIIGGKVLKAIDLKLGAGVLVEVENNEQVMLYALGLLLDNILVYDIEKIELYIYQPRMDNISTWNISAEELLKWADEVVRPAALKAFNGEGEFVAGDHCRFCKGQVPCKANAQLNLELAKYDFKDESSLNDAEIVDILNRAKRFTMWLDKVQEYAFKAALNGKKWEGWKLVKGRADRKYVDEQATGQFLLKRGYQAKDLFETKLLGITKMEKFLTKKVFNNILADKYVIKPEGAPTLVPESDKRPEIDSLEGAREDFENNADDLF